MDDAGVGNVVRVQAVTSYTALLFLATALCGILKSTPRSLYPPPPKKNTLFPLRKGMCGPLGQFGSFWRAEGALCPWYRLSLYQHISWGVKAAGGWGWQLYHRHVPIVLKSGSLNLLEPSGPVHACTMIALPWPSGWISHKGNVVDIQYRPTQRI